MRITILEWMTLPAIACAAIGYLFASEHATAETEVASSCVLVLSFLFFLLPCWWVVTVIERLVEKPISNHQ